MPEVGLQGARVVPLVCEGVAAGVPKHVRVRPEAQSRPNGGFCAKASIGTTPNADWMEPAVGKTRRG